MATARALLVGAGVHANTVLVPCLLYAGVRIASVVDQNSSTAAATAGKVGAQAFNDLAEALVDDYDLAVVAVPMDSQGDVVRTLIARGIPVFCEKPGGASAADIAATAELAQSRGVRVQVGFMRRYAPSLRLARHTVRRAQPVALQLAFAAGPAPDRRYYALDVGVHLVDLARFFLGDVELVAAVDGGGFWQCLLGSARGTAALCLSDQGSWGVPSERLWISAPGCSVVVDDYLTVRIGGAGRQELTDDRPARFQETCTQTWTPNFSSPRLPNNSLYLQGYVGELDAFLTSLAMGAPPTPGLIDAHAAVSLIEKVAKAVDLEPPDDRNRG